MYDASVCEAGRDVISEANVNLNHGSTVSPGSQSTNQHKGPNEIDLSFTDKPPFSKSCDDLLQDQADERPVRSQSCVSLNSGSSRKQGKYDHVQSKIKQYIRVLSKESIKDDEVTEVPNNPKELYLEEINLRLSRELDEKNALLNQLQQNYEHLLLKYAEAQNKIDNLRVQALKSDGYNENAEKSKYARKQISSTPIYPSNIPPIDCQMLNLNKLQPRQEPRIDRPCSLPVDGNLRVFEKDGLKAVTPTDSEGVSSVITSMSGHSKIINDFDEAPAETNDKNAALKSDVLEKTLQVSDPFDKVKNWQNSLPPLEFIETPDTALYDLNTPSTMYNELPVSELRGLHDNPKSLMQSQAVMKKYLRTLSLPSSLTRRNLLSQIYKKRNNHTIDLTSPLIVDCVTPKLEHKELVDHPNGEKPRSRDSPQPRIIQRRKKKPPFLRSASLPAYDYETPRILASIAVPPLDLDNLTLSEDETSPLNATTSASFLSSQDYSFQTNSRQPLKATLSDFSQGSVSRSKEQLLTPVLPNRCSMSFSQVSETDCCNVCGESVTSVMPPPSQMRPQDLSFVSSLQKSSSFHSDASSPSRCFQNAKVISDDNAIESFDVYANNLKARSDVIIKALTAHVKHS